MTSGIYEIANLTTGQRYVGSAVNFKRRWYAHRWHIERGEHNSSHLQATWNKHGASSFVFRPLLLCDRHNLLLYEQICIDALRPEYNKCNVAGRTLGFKFSEETRAKLSVRARNLSPETRAKMSASQGRRTQTPETRAKLSAIFAGRIVSEETRAKMREARKKQVFSAETCAKISASNKGRKNSPEAIEKMRLASTGRKHTAEAKAKISATKTGVPGWSKGLRLGPRSPETRAKISAAAQLRKLVRGEAKS